MKNNSLCGLVLTGGQGTRLRPLTLHRPKPLMPIANVPFLSRQLEWLRQHHIHELTLCMAESTAPYADFIRAESRRKTQLHCSKEPQPLGTAGALKNAERFINSDLVFIFNGDILTDINLSEMLAVHRKSKAKVTVALIAVADPSLFGLAVMNRKKQITQFIEKPSLSSLPKQKSYLVNAGTYLFDRSIFDRIPKGKNYSVEKELFPDCLKSGLPMMGYATAPKTYWLDIGTPDKYLQANRDILSGRVVKNASRPNAIGEKTKIGAGSQVDDKTVLGKNCIIGEGCIIKESVILDGTRIEDGCVIEHAIVGQSCKIGHHSILRRGILLGDRSVVTAYSKI